MRRSSLLWTSLCASLLLAGCTGGALKRSAAREEDRVDDSFRYKTQPWAESSDR
jgi:hypothetical protein